MNEIADKMKQTKSFHLVIMEIKSGSLMLIES